MTLHRRAKRLPLQPGPAAWNALLPARSPAASLVGDSTVDVAIIGAGFAGLSAARRLQRVDPGLGVAVLEAGCIAEGPAGRNSGFMIDIPHDLSSENYTGKAAEEDRAEMARNRQAIRFAERLASEQGLAREVFDRCGKVNAAASAASDRANANYASRLTAMGEPCTLLDHAQMVALTGTEFYSSGLFTPGTAMLQPAAYIRALATSLKPPVVVYENTPVTEIIQQPDSWVLETPEGRILAKRVILANNGHAESFGFFARRLMHVFTYSSMTDVLPRQSLGGAPRWGLTPADSMGTTVRRIGGAAGNRILVRSRFTLNPSMTASERQLASAGALHDRKFRARFPMLDSVGMAYRWAGHLCISRNGAPAHGEIEPGLFSAVCQNGLGLAKGTLAGISAAELALGMETETTRALCAMPKPARLPPEPFTSLGANAILRWKEWRSGLE